MTVARTKAVISDARERPAIRRVSELVARGFVNEADADDLERVAARYAVSITPDVADLIDATDFKDPIARQYVPGALELESTPLERADPIGDQKYSPGVGIVHRYPDRVLFKLVHVCAV